MLKFNPNEVVVSPWLKTFIRLNISVYLWKYVLCCIWSFTDLNLYFIGLKLAWYMNVLIFRQQICKYGGCVAWLCLSVNMVQTLSFTVYFNWRNYQRIFEFFSFYLARNNHSSIHQAYVFIVVKTSIDCGQTTSPLRGRYPLVTDCSRIKKSLKLLTKGDILF